MLRELLTSELAPFSLKREDACPGMFGMDL